MMRVGRPSVCSGGLNSSFFWPSLSKVNCWGVFECCIYNTWLILEEGECEKPQEYSAIPLWICMLSVSLCGERGSTVVEAYIHFSRGLFKYTLIIDGGSLVWWKLEFQPRKPKILFKNERENDYGPVGNRKISKDISVQNKEMTAMSFICQWNSKEFHLDRILFEDISLSTERQESKNK